MPEIITRRAFVARSSVALFGAHALRPGVAERHLLYVAEPGIRNYVEWGGIGILVFDIADNFRFVRRIPTPGRRERAIWRVPSSKSRTTVRDSSTRGTSAGSGSTSTSPPLLFFPTKRAGITWVRFSTRRSPARRKRSRSTT